MITASIERPDPIPQPPATVTLVMTEEDAVALYSLVKGLHVAKDSEDRHVVMSAPIPPYDTKRTGNKNGWLHMDIVNQVFHSLKKVVG